MRWGVGEDVCGCGESLEWRRGRCSRKRALGSAKGQCADDVGCALDVWGIRLCGRCVDRAWSARGGRFVRGRSRGGRGRSGSVVGQGWVGVAGVRGMGPSVESFGEPLLGEREWKGSDTIVFYLTSCALGSRVTRVSAVNMWTSGSSDDAVGLRAARGRVDHVCLCCMLLECQAPQTLAASADADLCRRLGAP